MTNELYYIIQARTGSSRLPFKMTKIFYNEFTIPEIIIKRLIENNIDPDKIIVATTINKQDDAISSLLCKYKVRIFRGSETNVLQRFIDAAKYYNANSIFRICGDNPFLNMKFLNQIRKLENFNEYDYISFYMNETIPAIKTHFGFFCEYTTLKTLEKIANSTTEKFETEHVTPYIYQNPDKFKIFKFEVPQILQKNTWLRLTIDTQEDFDTAKEIYSQIENIDDIENIVKVASNPTTRKQMEKSITQNSK